ncbi:MAG: undecaprenyl/decaprenyl-phosphate alpha-N-acetylglucosaminyl 1-phosphate transferase [Gammaproteobacteria bacterium]|nr:undecaprenyl/decaprenyl-phosphate alpha-N-acetylglucosaminyl 1-phosphate transferase [Gammaproteobacteria bacterium]
MFDSTLGIYLIIAFMAMAVSMAVIPLMMRFAASIGMMDQPDSRKVHITPVPRVGGIGIVLGALMPMAIWLPFNDLVLSYLVGSIVLLVFGIWDDAKEIGHYVKFIGQFIAAATVVYYGDLYVIHFPFMGMDLLPESIGRPFTVVAVVGMINAINHSDGLDGLAGGESLLSLAAIIYLGYLFDSVLIVVIAAATVGGVFGFLRFNSHPALVFMGDGGSQFLGFTLAFLVLVLTQQANEVLSPALPLLLLGLPIADILAVFILRARGGMNLFRATRNHIHHRLLELGFYHYEAVVIIYSIQMLLIVCAILMPYAYDWLIFSIYLGVCSAIFVLLTMAERKKWGIKHNLPSLDKLQIKIIPKDILIKISARGLETCVSLFLIAAAIMSTDIPFDIGVSSLFLLVALLFLLFFSGLHFLLYRLILFVTVGFSVYLLSTNPPSWLLVKGHIIYMYFGIVVILALLVARMAAKGAFKITPLDYLVIMLTLIIGVGHDNTVQSDSLIWMSIQIIILFYACELIIQNMTRRLNNLTLSAAVTLVLISLRSVI